MKRHLPWIIAALAILALIVVLLWPRKTTGPTAEVPVKPSTIEATTLHAVVWKTTGDVKVERNGQRTAAVQGQTVQSGDVIRVGQGEAELEFFSGARTVISGGTDLTVIEASVDPANAQKQTVKLAMGSQGRIWSRVLKLLSKDSTYELNVGGVVGGVRGTAFQTMRRAIMNTDSFWFDQFDGTLDISGAKASAQLYSGFSLSADLKNLPSDFTQSILATPDETRLDLWVQQQLKNDVDFVKRSTEIRKQLGDGNDYSQVGNETGPFTLNLPNAKHSGYHTVLLTASDNRTSLNAGEIVQLNAQAQFIDDAGKAATKEVTNQATWQISDPALAAVDKNGLLVLNKFPSGMFTVVARWNDGTHEHSGSLAFTFGGAKTPLK